MNESAQPASDEAYPPRLWWTKRIALWLIALAIVLGIVRLWWGHSAHQALEREIAKVRAAGEPVTVDDIQQPDIPDGENAAVSWSLAMAAINSNVNTPGQSNLEYENYPPYSAEFLQLLETGVNGNAKALALARQARSRSKVNWKTPLTTPLLNNRPSLNQARDLANIVGDSALHAHLHGDDLEAVERVRDVRRLAQDIDRQPFLVSHLVSIGIQALALSRLEVITPDLQIGDSTPPTIHPATREQLQAMVKQLVAESDDYKALHDTMAAERVAALDTTRFYARDAMLLRPMFDLAAAQELQESAIVVRAGDERTHTAAKQVLAAMQPQNIHLSPMLTMPIPSKEPQAAPRISRITNWMSAGSYAARFLNVDQRVRVEQRLAAVALAMRMYRVDHDEWPKSLDVLVPKYLPRVPQDPFATDKPIGYMLIKHGLPDGKDRPLIYSVGEAGDVDVEEKYAPPVPTYDWTRGSFQFRDLERWSPPPSTQPAEQ